MSEDENSQQRKCRFREFWRNWGSHIDAATIIAVLSVCVTVMVSGFNFISETKALPAHIKQQDNKISMMNAKDNLVILRVDRISQNMELLMRAMRLQPLPKTDTEKILEKSITIRANPLEATDEGQATNDE